MTGYSPAHCTLFPEVKKKKKRESTVYIVSALAPIQIIYIYLQNLANCSFCVYAVNTISCILTMQKKAKTETQRAY